MTYDVIIPAPGGAGCRLQEGVKARDARNMTVPIYMAEGSHTRSGIFLTLASSDFSSGVLAGVSEGAVEVSFFCTMNLADIVGEIEVVSADVRDLPRTTTEAP
jgi:hypothetical protein